MSATTPSPDRPPTAYPGPAFLAVGGSTMGYCYRGCQAWIRGRWVRAVDGGHSGVDIVDGTGYGHDCQGPTGESVRRYPSPGGIR